MTRTVTGLFDTYDAATEAVRELEAAGIPHSAISIVANNAENRWSPTAGTSSTSGAAAGASVGAALGGGAGLLAGLGLLAIPGLGPVVAAGWLAATAVGAVAGGTAGGLVGSLTGAGVSPEHAEVYAEGVRRGGSIVSARVEESLAPRAQAICPTRAQSTRSFVGQPIARRAGLRFDQNAPPFTVEEIERERSLY